MNVERRRLARALAAAGLLPSLATAARGEPARLHLYNWNNYVTTETLERFERDCGCRVVQDYYADNEELLAKLAAGAVGYDLLVPTGNAVESLIRQGALRPLDHARLPHLGNIDPAFASAWFDPGNRYSVPYAYSITLLGFNVERMRSLGIPTDSWAAIFEPEWLSRMQRKVTVLDSQRELFAAALMYLGHPAGSADPAHWRAARALILRAKPYWAAFNAASYHKQMALGNVWLSHGYSNDMHIARTEARAARRPFTIGYALPREGAVFALDNLVIHHTSRRPDLAHRFIDHILEGEASAALTNAIGAGSPNRAARARVHPALAADTTLFPPPETLARMQQLRDLGAAERRALNRLWIEIKVR